MLRIMFEADANVVDASPMYGRAEGVMGELLAETDTRNATFLATKVWTDRIDLMQIHNLVDWQTQLETLRLWKVAGISRYIGITHDTSGAIDRLVEVMENQDIDFVQMAYSIGERAVEDKLLPVAAERGIAVIVNRPCEGGDLLNSIRGEDVPEWAVEAGCRTWGQFFLKFTLSHPAVTCAIPATSNPNYRADNLESARGILPDKAMQQRMIRY